MESKCIHSTSCELLYDLPAREALVIFSSQQIPEFENFCEAYYLKEIEKIIIEANPHIEEVSFIKVSIMPNWEIYTYLELDVDEVLRNIRDLDVSEEKYYQDPDCYTNWENPDYADELNAQNYTWSEKQYDNAIDLPHVIWVNIYATRCNCSKFIEVVERNVEVSTNFVSYCKDCGKGNWREGAYWYETVRDKENLVEYIEQDYDVSEHSAEILKAMGYIE